MFGREKMYYHLYICTVNVTEWAIQLCNGVKKVYL